MSKAATAAGLDPEVAPMEIQAGRVKVAGWVAVHLGTDHDIVSGFEAVDTGGGSTTYRQGSVICILLPTV